MAISNNIIQKLLRLLRPLMQSESQRKGYLMRSLGMNTPILNRTGHTASVNAIAFSSTAKIIASGGEDNTIRIWNYQTGELIQTLEPQSLVNSLVFSPHAKILVSGTDNSKIRIWGVSS
jgi:WD40 repeat protein